MILFNNKKTTLFILLLAFLLILIVIFKQLSRNISETNITTRTPTPSSGIFNNSESVEFNQPSPFASSQTSGSIFPTATPPATGRGEPNFRQEINQEIIKALPLFNIISRTDFSAYNWQIYYSGNHELTVLLKQDTPEIRRQVLDWIINNGGNPAEHKIIWKIQQ